MYCPSCVSTISAKSFAAEFGTHTWEGREAEDNVHGHLGHGVEVQLLDRDCNVDGVRIP
jgi:hypothetical protein